MKTRRVIAASNLPIKPPIWPGLVVWLMLDRFNAPGWAYGVAFTIIGVIAIVAVIDIYNRTQVDLLNPPESQE